MLQLETPDQADVAKVLLEFLESNRKEALTSAQSTAGYAATLRDTEQQNSARTMRAAAGRLGAALEDVAKLLKRVDTGLRKPCETLHRRINEAERRQP